MKSKNRLLFLYSNKYVRSMRQLKLASITVTEELLRSDYCSANKCYTPTEFTLLGLGSMMLGVVLGVTCILWFSYKVDCSLSFAFAFLVFALQDSKYELKRSDCSRESLTECTDSDQDVIIKPSSRPQSNNFKKNLKLFFSI